MNIKLSYDFYLIFISKLFTSTAISVYTIYLILTYWNEYNSALIISFIYVAMSLIAALLSTIAGTHIDKFSQRKIGLWSIFAFLSISLFTSSYHF